MHVNDAISLFVLIPPALVFLLWPFDRRRPDNAMRKAILRSMMLLSIALIAAGVLFIKMTAENRYHTSHSTFLIEKKNQDVMRIGQSLQGLSKMMVDMNQQVTEYADDDKKNHSNQARELRDLSRHTSSLSEKIAWMQYLEAVDKKDGRWVDGYCGHYFSGPETSEFVPCYFPDFIRANTHWSTIFRIIEDRRDEAFSLIKNNDEEPVPICFLGILSEKGRYGHMGGGDRLFIVMDIQEWTDTSSCGHKIGGPLGKAQ